MCCDSSGSLFFFFHFLITLSHLLCFALCFSSLCVAESVIVFACNLWYKSRNWTWECLLADSSCTPNRHVPIHREEQNNSVMASWSWHAGLWSPFSTGLSFYWWNSLNLPFIFYFIWLVGLEGVTTTVHISVCLNPLRRLSIMCAALSTSWLTASCFPSRFLPSEVAGRGFGCPAPLEPSIMSGPTCRNRPPRFWPNMELKVWVDGVQRVVCGVTEATTCQEVVIALAQAIGG